MVPDNVIYLNTNDTSSKRDSLEHLVSNRDSDVKIVDIVPKDLEDLRINMRSRYAFNSIVLGKKKRK